MKYVLHPDVNLRKDGERVILYVTNPVESEMPDFVFSIDTPLAIFLAFQDGSMELEETLEVWSNLLFGAISVKYAAEQLKYYFTRSPKLQRIIKEILIPALSTTRRHLPDPADLIIDKRKLTLGSPRLKIPLRMVFIPTFTCSQKCFYCYSNEDNGKGVNLLPFARIKEILTDAREIGMETIDLSGGEVFTYDHIFELLEFINMTGLRANIPTKYPLSRDQIKRLKASGVTSLQFSIDAITPSILDKVVGVEGYSSRIVETFKYLEEENLRVRINIVVTPFNMNDVPSLITFLASHKNVYRIHLSPYAKSRFRHSNKNSILSAEYSELKAKVRLLLERRPDIRLFPGELPPDFLNMPLDLKRNLWPKRSLCTGGRWSFVLLPDGKATICEELYYHPNYLIGDLSTQSIMEMWDSPRALQVILPRQEDFPIGTCGSCAEFNTCHQNLGRCARETIKAYGENNHYYPDPRCPNAPISA